MGLFKESKHGKSRNKILIILTVFFLLVFLISTFILVKHFWPRKNQYQQYHKQSSVQSVVEELPDNPIDFDALFERNPDICGWINIPNTNVDYPILQSAEDEEEDFYLTHDPDKKKLFDGSIYIQKLNYKDFSDANTVIYGHNLANGGMFTQIRKYRNRQFFDEHPEITVYIPGHILTYQVYSSFIYDNRHILNSFNFILKEDYQNFLDQTLSPSSMTRQVRNDVPVTTDDRIITLSTCNNNPSQRYLVIGVLKNDQRTK